jgi:hypothetical protein
VTARNNKAYDEGRNQTSDGGRERLPLSPSLEYDVPHIRTLVFVT